MLHKSQVAVVSIARYNLRFTFLPKSTLGSSWKTLHCAPYQVTQALTNDEWRGSDSMIFVLCIGVCRQTSFNRSISVDSTSVKDYADCSTESWSPEVTWKPTDAFARTSWTTVPSTSRYVDRYDSTFVGSFLRWFKHVCMEECFNVQASRPIKLHSFKFSIWLSLTV